MTQKASILLCLFLLPLSSACTQANGDNSTAISQFGGEGNKAAREQDTANQQGALRLANERAKLAEERAEFEKQKREYAEQQLKEEQERQSSIATATVPQTYQAPSRQYESNHAQPSYQPAAEPDFTWISWETDEPLPRIGDVIETDDGSWYKIIGRQGYCLKGIPVEVN